MPGGERLLDLEHGRRTELHPPLVVLAEQMPAQGLPEDGQDVFAAVIGAETEIDFLVDAHVRGSPAGCLRAELARGYERCGGVHVDRDDGEEPEDGDGHEGDQGGDKGVFHRAGTVFGARTGLRELHDRFPPC